MNMKKMMKGKMMLMAMSCLLWMNATAQEQKQAYVAGSFWEHWFVQTGLDMSLQNPYGHSFSHVFPNGKSFGVNVAAGKWFSPYLALRGRFNWENGIVKNSHDNWIAPFYQPGENHRKGGYITVTGDIQIDLHNILCGYKPDRRWNLQVFPRAGAAYNFGVTKGSPLLGFGVGNTFRLSPSIGLYADLAYNMVSSGFTGDKGTGTGSNSNGFFDLSVGVQWNLGSHRGFEKKTVADNRKMQKVDGEVVAGSFWGNWFVQAGLDMSLQNPYGKSFSQVFPKGKSFGLDVAVGKWFSPYVAVRGKINWENGCKLMENGHIEWIAPAEDPKSNIDEGGYVTLCIDVPLSVKNIFIEYDPQQKWNFYAFPRMGLGCNLAISSSSPLVGVGMGGTYRIKDRWSVYADCAYQCITSEFMGGVAGTGMQVSSGSNGFADFNIGVQYDL